VKATATRTSGYMYRLDIRQHQLIADEPRDQGGEDQGPTPQELLAASLASCMAITMEMYAMRKGWEVGQIEVEVEYDQPDSGEPTEFRTVLRLPSDLTDEQAERLKTIAGKCPVHRVLGGEVKFSDRIERT
jgi:putative redox protein